MPKLNFSKFSGSDPMVWLDKCKDYFIFFKVPESMWATIASLHMEDNAACWLQLHKLTHNLSDWVQFATDVKAKFGVHEYPKALRLLQV
jgi:hypothetical protein